MALTGKHPLENEEALSSTSSVTIDHVQGVRQTKGNQGVNDELRMKADELEKLFAEHKLRVSGDQTNSASRIRPPETVKVSEPVEETIVDDNQDDNVTPEHSNIYRRSFSDDSRGTLYQKYMQKRDAKLREDWSLNRLEKDAQMKAMHDSLEKNRAVIIKLVCSAEKTRFGDDTQRRAVKIGSFNVRLAMNRDQQPIDIILSNANEEQTEVLRKNSSELYLEESPLKSAPAKRVQQPNKNASSQGTRKSTAAVPRSSGNKASHNSGAARRRIPYDHLGTQSVSNFSDFRKENTRPSPGVSKPARILGKNHARKKSTADYLSLVDEEKSRRFQSLRKSVATTKEMNASHNLDDADNVQVMPSIYHVEDNEGCRKISDVELKTLPESDNGTEDVAARHGVDFDNTLFGTTEVMEVVKGEEHQHETTVVEESAYKDDFKERLSYESDKSGFSQAGSFFRSTGSTLESPGESPIAWNLRQQNAFAFTHEPTDVDASDSPSATSASWNIQALSQQETEAARMRKQWGAAQKPIVAVETSSNSPSRKDLARGLKRLLKFGRKNRTSESTVDWISATTSEGDDSEDGRDFITRTSEDLRKSRMGLISQSQNSDEGLTETALFNEQEQTLRSSSPNPPSNCKTREERLSGSSFKAPKSFFSLSNFRSKASDSKPR